MSTMLIYIVILNCSLNKIFDSFQIRMKIQKNFEILKALRKVMNHFVWKLEKNYGILG